MYHDDVVYRDEYDVKPPHERTLTMRTAQELYDASMNSNPLTRYTQMSHDSFKPRPQIAGQQTLSDAGVTMPTTEADPNGVSPHSPGAKLDAGKADLSLMLDFPRAIRAVGDVATFGANKYTRGGWLEVKDGERRYTAALLRHLFAVSPVDTDSGLAHAAHAAWNALARLELALRATEAQTVDHA